MKLKISLLYVMIAFTGQLLNAQEEIKSPQNSYSWQPLATSGTRCFISITSRYDEEMGLLCCRENELSL